MIEIEKTDEEKAAKEQAERLEAYKKQYEDGGERTVTIPRILEEVANIFCDHYCKWPEKWDEEKEGCELCESWVCANCPVNKLT